MKTPDITPAQYASVAGWIVAQAVAAGLLHSTDQQLAVSIGATLLALGWKAADAIIRSSRSKIGFELAAQAYQRELRYLASQATAAQAPAQIANVAIPAPVVPPEAQ